MELNVKIRVCLLMVFIFNNALILGADEMFCPSQCRCVGTTTDCSGGIPNPDEKTEILILSNNPQKVNKLPEILKNLTELRSLYLSNLSSNFSDLDLSHLSKLQTLDLSGNSISNIINLKIDSLKNLMTLNLHGNKLKNLESLNGSLVQYLNLSHNEFEAFPEVLENFPRLRELDFSHNSLTSLNLQKNLNSSSLKILDLSNNKFENFSEVLENIAGAFPKLQKLNISYNSLTWIEFKGSNDLTMPERNKDNTAIESEVITPNSSEKIITGLKNLRLLDLSHNKLESLPQCIRNLTEVLPLLEDLNLSHNKLATLEFEQSMSLIILDASTNDIMNVTGIDKLIKLRFLNLYRNKLTNLENLESLGLLEELDISENQFESLPEVMKNLTNFFPELRKLNFSKNSLRKIEFVQSQKLKVLDLSENQLANITNMTGIDKLKGLKTLNISRNKLTSLDDVNSTSLQHLDFSSNEFVAFPMILKKFPELRVLNLSGNAHLNSTIFDESKQLKILDLSRTKIAHLSNVTGIDKITSLEILHLSENKNLKNLDGLTTSNSLRELYAKNCAIQEVRNNSLDNSKQLMVVDLSGNPIEVFNKTINRNLLFLDLSNASLKTVGYEFLSNFPNLIYLKINNDLINGSNDSKSQNIIKYMQHSKLILWHASSLTSFGNFPSLKNYSEDKIDNIRSLVFETNNLHFSKSKFLKDLSVLLNVDLRVLKDTKELDSIPLWKAACYCLASMVGVIVAVLILFKICSCICYSEEEETTRSNSFRVPEVSVREWPVDKKVTSSPIDIRKSMSYNEDFEIVNHDGQVIGKAESSPPKNEQTSVF